MQAGAAVGGHCSLICVRRMSYKSTGHSVNMVVLDTGHGQLQCSLTTGPVVRRPALCTAALCVVWSVSVMEGERSVIILSLLGNPTQSGLP